MDAHGPTALRCSVCDRPVLARGLCMLHYQRQRRAALARSARVRQGDEPMRWPSEVADHTTSSGVRVDMLQSGGVLVSAPGGGMVSLTEVQWRELASYAMAWSEQGS